MEIHKGEREKRVEHELERTNAYVLVLLKDKRRLNTELQNERKVSRKLRQECYDLRRKLGAQQSIGSRLDSFATTDCLINMSENSTEELERKIRKLEESLCESRTQIKSLEEHKTVLESEILRLAEALGKDSSSSDLDLMIEQLNIYETDFQKERDDREKAETKVSVLTDQISDCQDLISSLTREVDLYKNAFEREKKDKEIALGRDREKGEDLTVKLPTFPTAGSSPNFPGSEHNQELASPVQPPHLQVVYPVVDSRIQHQNSIRKRELHRRGVLTRDSPESLNYN